MGQTMVEKICQRHLAEGPDRPLRTGDVISLRPRHVMTHDNTAPVIKKFKGIGATKVKDPKQVVFTLDHEIQNTTEENLAKYRQIEDFAKQHGIDFHPAGTGIGHQIMVSHGYVVPNSLVVASDSHSNMYGALGACGTPVVRTDAAAIWATGEFWWQIPRSIQVTLTGKMQGGATGKDVIITLCGLYNKGEVLNAAVEFVGPGVANLSMDERMAISNMTTEWGALVGWFPADAVTVEVPARAQGQARPHALQRRRPRGVGEEPGDAGRRRGLCRQDHARPRRRVAARQRPRHRAGHALGGRHREGQGEDPEGVPGLLREQSSRGSRGRGEGDQGPEGRRGRRVLRGRGERRGAGGRRGERGLGRAGRGGRETVAVGLRHVHRPGGRPARGGRGGDLRHQPQLQGPHGLARREGLPGQPAGGGRVGRRRLHHGAVRGGRQAAGLHVRGGGRQGRGRRRRRSPSSTASPRRSRGRWSSCRWTT